MLHINVIGGGLAGCEAAWQIARQGIKVRLWEMRPQQTTPVHNSADLAELVCSNSLKSELPDSAQGLLKSEMRMLGSLLLECADKCRVPAGSALAVDRQRFAQTVTQKIEQNPYIEIIRQEMTSIPAKEITIIATGPLTSDRFSQTINRITGEENLYFYDAVAPSVTLESLDHSIVFKASRYGKGEDDYYNCPLTQEEYNRFYEELIKADIKEGHEIDKKHIFEGCIPIEVMARRGIDTLRFGPMRPVGLNHPITGQKAWAVVQLRQENKEGTVIGLVGFQTRLKWGEQERVFRLIPGLQKAEFVRFGVMHRNTYINSPQLLKPTLEFKKIPGLYFAGQITGVEGYMESAASGIIAGINACRQLKGQNLLTLSRNTILGALLDYITTADKKKFQPMNANFGLLPPLEEKIKDKKTRYKLYVQRSRNEMQEFSEKYLNVIL